MKNTIILINLNILEKIATYLTNNFSINLTIRDYNSNYSIYSSHSHYKKRTKL